MLVSLSAPHTDRKGKGTEKIKIKSNIGRREGGPAEGIFDSSRINNKRVFSCVMSR